MLYNGGMPRFVSQPIEPIEGTFDPGAMVRGEPALPSGFRWNGREFTIATDLGPVTQPAISVEV